MAWWRRLLPGRKGYTTLDLFKEIYGGRAAHTGKSVTVQTALDVVTVLGCVRVLAEGVAQIPLKLFQETDRARMPAKEHPLYRVLFRRPNDWQTSFEYRETLMFHLALCGNHFSYVNRIRGDVVELIPFEPRQVKVTRAPNYDLSYEITSPDGGSKQAFPAAAIWHVRGPSWNSWMGMEAVTLARDAIGLAMSIEEQQASFYKNGAHVSGMFSIDGTLTDEQHKQLNKWIEQYQTGGDKAGGTLLLDRAAKFTQRVMSAVDAQTLESRRHQIEEICRAFRVMPIMVGFSDKTATYASAEQMFLAHVVHTLSPWYERIEQSIDVSLLSDADQRAGLYAKFVEEGLLRGALKDTAAYLKELCLAGIMTRNEARAKLEMNPLPGLDTPLEPANITGKKKPDDDASSDDNPKSD